MNETHGSKAFVAPVQSQKPPFSLTSGQSSAIEFAPFPVLELKGTI